MDTVLDLKETSKYLLSLDPDFDYTDDELDQQDSLAEQLINDYSWPVVYHEWCNYLYNCCPTDTDVIRFAHNFWDYGGERPIPDPIRFIAYLYYRVDVRSNTDAFDIFDSLAISILPRAGLVNMIEEPCYAAESDPRIQAEIEKWRQIESISKE